MAPSNSSFKIDPSGPISVVGAGLAGSECALQLAALGHDVVLFEMRTGGTSTPAHHTQNCAELVCSNSFGSLAGHSAPGLLKWEAEQMGSQILAAGFESRVPAGQALGMDRDLFAARVTERVRANPRIRIESRIVESLDDVPRPAVIATGPLTHPSLAASMREHFGDEFLYFFDAIAPIISTDSINMNIAWRADRWDKGTKDYINCPLTKKEYHFFIQEMKDARKVDAKSFEAPTAEETPYFDGCMPIETMLERGDMTPRFGPMSAKGLRDPRTGNTPFAVVQLRQDNREATAYNIVGFQTKMAYADQKRVFRLIPGLESAEFLKLGSIHRNLYINTPRSLHRDLSSKKDPWLFFAGQITGVEGYFESTCMGMLVARFVSHKVAGRYSLDASDLGTIAPPRASGLGSLLNAITDETKIDHFQPTNINFGHLPDLVEETGEATEAEGAVEGGYRQRKRFDKKVRRQKQVNVAKAALTAWMPTVGLERPATCNVDEASASLAAITAAAELVEKQRKTEASRAEKLERAAAAAAEV